MTRVVRCILFSPVSFCRWRWRRFVRFHLPRQSSLSKMDIKLRRRRVEPGRYKTSRLRGILDWACPDIPGVFAVYWQLSVINGASSDAVHENALNMKRGNDCDFFFTKPVRLDKTRTSMGLPLVRRCKTRWENAFGVPRSHLTSPPHIGSLFGSVKFKKVGTKREKNVGQHCLWFRQSAMKGLSKDLARSFGVNVKQP